MDSFRQILLAKRFATPRDEALLRSGLSEDFPKGSAPYLRAGRHSRVFGGDAASPRASSDNDKFALCVGGHGAKRILKSMLKDQRNRCAEVRQAFFARFPLTVCARHFRTVRDVPGAVLLDDGRELNVHGSIVSFGCEGIGFTRVAAHR